MTKSLEELRLFFDKLVAINGMKYYILDLNHQPVEVPMLEWAQWFGTDDKQLAFDECNDDIERWCVSSIFLGFDHSRREGEGHPKLLYETMTFVNGDTEVYRFTSYDELMAFHADEVKRLKR